MANFTAEDGVRMQAQVGTLMAQMQTLADQNTTVTRAFDAFRAMASQEIQNLKAHIAAPGGGVARADSNGLNKLIDVKDFKPQVFSGSRDQDYKPWRKLFLTYANLQCPGFRTALEWIENRKTEIDEQAIRELNWPLSEEAGTKLWDFLSLMTKDDALMIVESVKGRGFESWRLIHERYAPKGGRHELSKMTQVFKRKQCKNIDELPRAVDDLEKDIRGYNKATGFSFPTELKLPLLLECLPASHKAELEMKYTMGQRDYDKVVRTAGRTRM